MKNRFSFILTYWWCMVLAALGLAALFTGDPAGGVSEKENRNLEALPALTFTSWTDGSFTEGLESFLLDHVPGRNRILDASAAIKSLFSAESAQELILNGNMEQELVEMGGSGETDAPESASPTPQVFEIAAPTAEATPAPSLPPSQSPAAVAEATQKPAPLAASFTEEELNAIHSFRYRKTDGGTSLIYQFDRASVEKAANTLNAYRDALKEDGAVYFTQVPYSQAANTWLFSPNTYCGWESDVEPVLQHFCKDGVYVFNTINELESHMQAGEAVFFKTDHHWAPLGASYISQSMLSFTGVPPVSYGDFAYTVHEPFYGSITKELSEASITGVSDRLEVPTALAPAKAYVYKHISELIREVRYMEPERSSYSAMLGGTHTPYLVVKTGFHTGRNALVICDSFGNAFIPYIAPYYDTVCQADLRPSNSFGSSGGGSVREYIEYYDIDDVYFVSATGCGINSYFFQKTVLDYLDKA